VRYIYLMRLRRIGVDEDDKKGILVSNFTSTCVNKS